jgi:mevalonate kinase
VTAASQASTDVLKANRRMVDEFDEMMKEFVEYQKLSYQTMEQVRRLLADVSAAGTRDVYLTGGRNASTAQKETLSRIQRLLEEQGENQQALLEEISGSVKDLSKAAQKGKFSLFK